MRKVILAFSLAMSSLAASAQILGSRILTHTTAEGTMYFVSDKSVRTNSKGIKKFVFDVTYIEGRDSAVINFTVISKNPGDVVGLTLSNGAAVTKADNVGLLYHQFKGSKYEIRTTSRVSYKDFREFYSSARPVEFIMKRADGTEDSAKYTPSKWKKEHKFFEKVFYIIN